MSGIEHATLGILIVMLLVVVPVLYYIHKARRSGENLYVRRVAGVDAISEAMGRAAELGRPVSFSTGLASVGPVLYACLGVLFHVTRLAARYKSKLLIPSYDPEVMAISEDIIRDGYREEGKSSLFDASNILYLSSEQFAYAAGYSGLVQRERVGAAFLFGEFAAESLVLSEAGQQAGAMQIAATISPEQVPFFICTCEYTLIGEELYGAAAYLTREPVQLGSLLGQDRAKLLFLIIIVIGVCIATWNSLYPEMAIDNVEKYLLYKLW